MSIKRKLATDNDRAFWRGVETAAAKGREMPEWKSSGLSFLRNTKDASAIRKSDLTEDMIVEAMKEYYNQNGKYPSVRSGDASEYFKDNETWSGIHECIRYGSRGLPGGSSLSKLKKKHFDIKEKERLTEGMIVKAIEKYYDQNGRYPSKGDGDASEYFKDNETWRGINACLKQGNRGLPGGSSLSKLKKKHICIWRRLGIL